MSFFSETRAEKKAMRGAYTENMNFYADMINFTNNPFVKGANAYKAHFLFWSIFIFYESVLIGLYTGHFSSLTSYALHYLVNIGLFYVHVKLLARVLIGFKGYLFWVIPLMVLTELIGYIGVLFSLEYLFVNYTDLLNLKAIKMDHLYLISAVYRALYFMGFATGYHFLLRSIRLERKQLSNRIQLAEYENAMLKAQINPHFLFNILNFIYYNAKEHSPLAAETILALSDMMRYSSDLSQSQQYILLGNEVEQVENLINLHQLREGHSLNIRLDYEDDVLPIMIIPMILISLAENMFKHGNLRSKDYAAKLSVRLQSGDLIIETANLIGLDMPRVSLKSGTLNIKKRLDYNYGKNAIYNTRRETNIFFTHITISGVSNFSDATVEEPNV